MNNQSVSEIIQEILDKNKRPFITVNQLSITMGAEIRRLIGIEDCHTAAAVRKVIEPQVKDKFIFHKKGPVLYILVPCQPEDLVIAEMDSVKGKSAKLIARSLPFSKADVAKILNNLVDSGRAKNKLNENLDTRYYLIDSPEKVQLSKVEPIHEPERTNTHPSDYSREEFMKAFDGLDNGRIFVRICDLRKKLNWPRDLFDAMLMMLRDKELIQMHVADESTMTPDEIKDCFVDENNYRMGTVTRNVR